MPSLRTKRYALILVLASMALVLFFGGNQLVLLLERIADFQKLATDAMLSHPSVILWLIAYVLLLAIPFVPGAQLGLFLLLLFGADIALIVYGATVLGMSLSYAVGSFVPREKTQRIYANLGGDSLSEATRGCEVGDTRWFCRVLRYRYAVLAVTINMPGNTVLGGGGGIALAAGLSRLYGPAGFLATVSLGSAPVPIAFLVAFWACLGTFFHIGPDLSTAQASFPLTMKPDIGTSRSIGHSGLFAAIRSFAAFVDLNSL